MKPQEFFDLADRLVQNNSNPSSFRTSISRAYCAALHQAIVALGEMSVSIPGGTNIHEKVPDLLGHSMDTELVLASERLKNLREDRNQADYRLDNAKVEVKQFVELRLNDARQIIGAINTFRMGRGNPGSRFEIAAPIMKARARLIFLGA